MRTTTLNGKDALAIRWEQLPKDEDAPVIAKKEIFEQLKAVKCQNLMFSLSEKRKTETADGSSKEVRCIVICLTAFKKDELRSLKEGKQFSPSYCY